jgi:beta-lactamase class A
VADQQIMRTLRRIVLTAAVILAVTVAHAARAQAFPAQPFLTFGQKLRQLAASFPAPSAIDVMDLSTGLSVGYNENAPMPAASTIKLPVMVAVFAQLEAGVFNLNRRVTLLESDKDFGSGDLCDAPAGTSYSIDDLLARMIDVSDNTATNMLIRLVGRRSINQEMRRLGLHRTHLATDVRTDEWSVRRNLVSSPRDMVHLLALMAKRRLVDAWSSGEMIAILEGDQINTLLPQPLPDDVPIAHKTGSFFDTLNDVGIVYETDAPYVIAVMTTRLPSLDAGRNFIHTLSHMAFVGEARFARWRAVAGYSTTADADAAPAAPIPPDVRYWDHADAANQSGG